MMMLRLFLLPLCIALLPCLSACGGSDGCMSPPAGQVCIRYLSTPCAGSVPSGADNKSCTPDLCQAGPATGYGVSVGCRCFWQTTATVTRLCPADNYVCFTPSTSDPCLGAATCTSSADCLQGLCSQAQTGGIGGLCAGGHCMFFDTTPSRFCP